MRHLSLGNSGSVRCMLHTTVKCICGSGVHMWECHVSTCICSQLLVCVATSCLLLWHTFSLGYGGGADLHLQYTCTYMCTYM